MLWYLGCENPDWQVGGERWWQEEMRQHCQLRRWGDRDRETVMSLHFYMSKNVRNKKINRFPELDYNFPKEILQTVNNRTEYVTQAYLIYNEAGLWNTNYHCFYVKKTFQKLPLFLCEEDLPESSSHLPWNNPTVEVVPAPLSSICESKNRTQAPSTEGRGVYELDTRDKGTARC